MTFESSKMMGGIGAILMVVGGFAGPYTGVIGVIGLALVLVALNGLANLYNDRHIFNNAIFAVLATIVGAVIAAVVVVAAAFGILDVLGIQVTWTNWSALQNFNWNNFTDWSKLAPYIAAIVGALVILVVCLVIAAIFLRRSLNTVAEKSGTHMFATAGLLFLIGAALTIIGIGFLLIWISLILLAVAFFEMKTGTDQPQTPSPPS
ncbi:MAG TPA: DUF996 domain-containing protein [candidate division Zixibacteria bacterium]|nr:DUF996 domain-containing protein [candidate division Zixibacteria bacterium]